MICFMDSFWLKTLDRGTGGQILTYATRSNQHIISDEFNITIGMPSGKTHYFPHVAEV